MDIRKCHLCGKMYQFIRSPYCGDCLEEIDQQYMLMRNYLDDNPQAQIPQVAKATGVSERIIFYLLREGRLHLGSKELVCDRCKTPIDSGRMCASCLSILHKGLGEIHKASLAFQERENESSNRNDNSHKSVTASSEQQDSGMHIHRKKRQK